MFLKKYFEEKIIEEKRDRYVYSEFVVCNVELDMVLCFYFQLGL